MIPYAPCHFHTLFKVLEIQTNAFKGSELGTFRKIIKGLRQPESPSPFRLKAPVPDPAPGFTVERDEVKEKQTQKKNE